MLLLLLEYNLRVKCENAVEGVSRSFSGTSAGVCCFYCLSTISMLNVRMLLKGIHEPLVG